MNDTSTDKTSPPPRVDRAQIENAAAQAHSADVAEPAPHPIPPEASGAYGETALDLRSSAALAEAGEGSLPVLDAFRDFLEAERRRAHRRMVALSVTFSVLFLLLLAVGGIGGRYYYNRMNRNYTQVRNELTETAERLSLETDGIMSRVNGEAVRLRDDLARRQSVLEGSLHSNIAIRAETYDVKLGSVREVVAMLETENSLLRKELQLIQSDLPSISNEVTAVLARLRHMESARAAGPRRSRPVAPPPPQVSMIPTSYRSLPMKLRLHDRDRFINWQAAIPE